jgi:hypothetical protein
MPNIRRVVIEDGRSHTRDRNNFEVQSRGATGLQRPCISCGEPTDSPIKFLNHWWCNACKTRVQNKANARPANVTGVTDGTLKHLQSNRNRGGWK